MSNKINHTEIIEEEEEVDYFPKIIKDIDDFDIINQNILKEINRARQSPEEYITILDDILKRLKYKDNYLFLDKIPFIYNDLFKSLMESIQFLKSQQKLPNLIYNQSISDCCENLLYAYVNNPEYKNNNIHNV